MLRLRSNNSINHLFNHKNISYESSANILAKELPGDAPLPFITFHHVYVFRYNKKVVAAISIKETNRKFWIANDASPEIKNVVASAAVI
jgi:hypothetical protein